VNGVDGEFLDGTCNQCGAFLPALLYKYVEPDGWASLGISSCPVGVDPGNYCWRLIDNGDGTAQLILQGGSVLENYTGPNGNVSWNCNSWDRHSGGLFTWLGTSPVMSGLCSNWEQDLTVTPA